MASELSTLVRAATGQRFINVGGAVGEDGQGIVFLEKGAVPKGVNGRSFAAAIIWTRAVTRLAKASDKTFGVGAVVLTHGETDAGNTHYEAEIHQLWADYNTDVKAITGQSQNLQMILSQQDSVWPVSTIAQWKLGVDYPADIVCSGPKYQYPTWPTVCIFPAWGTKCSARSTRRSTSNVSCAADRGIEVTAADGSKVTISSVAIAGDTVVITCAADPGPGARVSYATVGDEKAMAQPFHGTTRWGLLRESRSPASSRASRSPTTASLSNGPCSDDTPAPTAV